MLPTVQLNDQPTFDRGKIGEIRANRELSPKLDAVNLAVSQVPPEDSLGIG